MLYEPKIDNRQGNRIDCERNLVTNFHSLEQSWLSDVIAHFQGFHEALDLLVIDGQAVGDPPEDRTFSYPIRSIPKHRDGRAATVLVESDKETVALRRQSRRLFPCNETRNPEVIRAPRPRALNIIFPWRVER
jgi:hypothetical protein